MSCFEQDQNPIRTSREINSCLKVFSYWKILEQSKKLHPISHFYFQKINHFELLPWKYWYVKTLSPRNGNTYFHILLTFSAKSDHYGIQTTIWFK